MEICRRSLLGAAILVVCVGCRTTGPRAPYPASPYITGIDFDMSTVRNVGVDGRGAPGSDNWAITWADDDHQYAAWGDGGGFGGDNARGRVTLGVARIEGGPERYRGYNVWGGLDAENPATFGGKSYGILSIDGVLYLWRTGERSDESCFTLQELHRSPDHGATWTPVGVAFRPEDFPASRGFFAPTFLQFGKDYRGARDDYVYSYAPEQTASANPEDAWDVQVPGRIALLRVPKAQIDNRSAYEFFAGLDERGNPRWTKALEERRPVFTDARNGLMRTSVSFNPGIGRYLLITQHRSRFRHLGGYIGIYEAPEPWGPWSTVLFADAWAVGRNGHLHDARPAPGMPSAKTVYWNFANKWLSADGTRFVLVYTGPGSDQWGTVEGSFRLTHRPDANR